MFLEICLTSFICLLVYKIYNGWFSPYSLFPEPKGWFGFGHIPFFILENDHLSLFTKWCDEFYEEGLFKVDVIGLNVSKAVVLTNVQFSKTLLTKPNVFPRTSLFKTLFPLFGESLLTVEGDEHRLQKRILSKAFTLPQMKHYLPVVNHHADILMQCLKSAVGENGINGTNVVVGDFFGKFSYDVIGKLAFGVDFDTQLGVHSEFVAAFKESLLAVTDTKSKIILRCFPFLKKLNIGPFKKISDAVKICEDTLDEVLKTRYSKIESGVLTESEKTDLLSMMINARDDETLEQITEKNVKDNCCAFLVAGQETTANSLCWLTYCFAKYPHFTERAKEEIQATLQNKDVFTVEDITSLIFTNDFIKESLRHYGVVPFNARICKEQATMGKYTLPKGCHVVVPQFFHNINEEYDFNPDRYSRADKPYSHPSFVFGYGPYSCVGKNLALLEIRTVAIKLLQNFTFSLDEEFTTYARKATITMKSYPEVTVRLKVGNI